MTSRTTSCASSKILERPIRSSFGVTSAASSRTHIIAVFLFWQIRDMADLEKIIDEAASSAGYSSLKVEQRKALKAFAEGRDVFVSLPTGHGKSLCYALLPAIFDRRRNLAEKTSIVMIISPLVALMKDQTSLFTTKGISAAYVSDKYTTDKDTRRGVLRGQFQLVFISPESLFVATEWRRMLAGDLYRKNLVGFIVDEAHCVKKW